MMISRFHMQCLVTPNLGDQPRCAQMHGIRKEDSPLSQSLGIRGKLHDLLSRLWRVLFCRHDRANYLACQIFICGLGEVWSALP